MKSKFINILLFSIFISLISILISVCGYIFEISQSTWYSFATLILNAIVIFLLQRYYQKKVFLNTASFKKLLLDTFYMIIIASLIVSVFAYIYLKYISPEEIEAMLVLIKNTLYNMYSNILPESQIEQSYEISAKFINPLFISISGFFGFLIQSFIIDIISSAINKSKQYNRDTEVINNN